jgi:hypothetical protein
VASLHPDWIDRLFLVSCPTSVENITLSGGTFLNPLALMFRKNEFKIKGQEDMFFRWGPIFAKKPNARDLAKQIKIPASFLVAEKDTLVFESLSKDIFDAYAGPKTWTEFKDGLHAEAMFLQDPEKFLIWLKDEMGCAT